MKKIAITALFVCMGMLAFSQTEVKADRTGRTNGVKANAQVHPSKQGVTRADYAAGKVNTSTAPEAVERKRPVANPTNTNAPKE